MRLHPRRRYVPQADGLFLALALFCAACSTATAALAQVATQSRGWRASPSAAIKIHAPSGTLVVEGWARDSVSMVGTLAKGETFFGGGTVNGLKFGAEGTVISGSTSLLVRVPFGARLVIRSGSANVQVSGLTSTIDVGSAAGSVDVSGNADAVTAESISGDVRIHVNAPAVRARTTGGRLEVAGRVGEAQLTSVSGVVALSGQPIGAVRVETVDGRVDISGAIAKSGSIDVRTFGGSVELGFPVEQRAALDLRAQDGTISGRLALERGGAATLDLQSLVSKSGRTMSLMRTVGLGTGAAAPVSVRTTRGAIKLRTLPQ